jgi:hypothetical protein
MPLSQSDRAELDRLGADNVRHRLSYSGPGRDAVIGSFGPGFSMTRGDVEEWLVEKSQEATKLQRDILWWAKAATWVGVTIILVMIALTALSYIFPTD